MRQNDPKLFLSFIPPVSRKLQTQFQKDDKNINKQHQKHKGHKKVNSTIQQPPHRLTLKDYLRLANINKRSNSGAKSRSRRQVKTERNSIDKDKSMDQNNSISKEEIEQNRHEDSTIRSIQLVKEQLKQDIKIAEERMRFFTQNLEKHNPKFHNSKQAYNQLVFLCQLHRQIKQTVQGGVQKANRMLAYHIHDQIYNFIGKSQNFIQQEGLGARKRSRSPRKRNLTGTQMVKDSGQRRRPIE